MSAPLNRPAWTGDPTTPNLALGSGRPDLTLVPDGAGRFVPDPNEWLRRARFDTTTYDVETIYYEGGVRLAALGWALPPEMAVLQTVVNWCAMAVDSLTPRLRVSGFRQGGAPRPSEALTELWRRCGMVTESPVAITEALVHQRGYLSVGIHPRTELPIIRAETRRNLWADIDSATGEVLGAVRDIAPELGDPTARCVVYLPDATHYFALGTSGAGWSETDRIEHDLGRPTIVPMTHRPTAWRRGGASRMRDVALLTDACCRALTNLAGAQELLAVPQRYVLGAQEGDFTDPATGKPRTKWEMYLARFLALGNEDAQVGSLPAADLRNFVEVINLYAKLTAGTTGLPPDYLGYSDANPTSADAILASRERLVSDAEGLQPGFGDAYENALAIAVQLLDGEGALGDDAELALDCVWDDAATPTYAARADAAVKLFSAGLVPREAVWDLLGYDAAQQSRYARLMDDDPLERFVRGGAEDPAVAAGGPTVPPAVAPAAGAVPATGVAGAV